jgi:choline kinase
MKALILSAGQGSRLLPLTANRPKCLLPLDSLSVIEWQIRELQRCGIGEFVVVVGFRADDVERVLLRLNSPDVHIRTIYNPFYQVADNLSTCWLARHEMDEDFLLLNGDTIFEAGVPARLLAEADAPVTVTIDRSTSYDADDMKVRTEGDKLAAIGKWLPAAEANGESIGMMLFRGAGPELFAEELERVMRTPEGLDYWYTSVIDALAKRGIVGGVSIEGLGWGEIDFPVDLQRARALVARWTAAEEQRAGAAT